MVALPRGKETAGGHDKDGAEKRSLQKSAVAVSIDIRAYHVKIQVLLVRLQSSLSARTEQRKGGKKKSLSEERLFSPMGSPM